MESPRFAIAFTVREKFGWALAALRRIYANFGTPFTLYFVDCGYPPAVRAEIEKFLRDKANVVRIEAGHFLLPGESLNLVVPRISEDYLYVISNDVLIEPHFGARALETFEKRGCALVYPETIEIQRGWREPHREELAATGIVAQDGKLRVEVPLLSGFGKHEPVRRVHHIEVHALAMTRAAARTFYPFAALSSREHIDLAVHAWRLGLAIYKDNRARAGYVVPPIRDYDLAYFRFRWDRRVAEESRVCVARRWNIVDIPDASEFVDDWNNFARDDVVQRDYQAVCEEDDFPAVFD